MFNILFHLSTIALISLRIYHRSYPPPKTHLVSSDRLARIISLKCLENKEKVLNICSEYYVINDNNETATFFYALNNWQTFYINEECYKAL